MTKKNGNLIHLKPFPFFLLCCNWIFRQNQSAKWHCARFSASGSCIFHVRAFEKKNCKFHMQRNAGRELIWYVIFCHAIYRYLNWVPYFNCITILFGGCFCCCLFHWNWKKKILVRFFILFLISFPLNNWGSNVELYEY